MFDKKKNGEILVENVIFIILNLVFLIILILFLIKQGAGAISLEQVYSKKIALIIDSSSLGMIIKINMQDAKEIAEKNSVDFSNVVFIDEITHSVTVKLTEKGGYSYSYFNDAKVNAYSDGIFYIITIDKKLE
ncbi:MAG: hypothetical protein WC812_03630 [Candidatus Pacearchaeota archaeon]|jgi:hypothetical protein